MAYRNLIYEVYKRLIYERLTVAQISRNMGIKPQTIRYQKDKLINLGYITEPKKRSYPIFYAKGRNYREFEGLNDQSKKTKGAYANKINIPFSIHNNGKWYYLKGVPELKPKEYYNKVWSVYGYTHYHKRMDLWKVFKNPNLPKWFSYQLLIDHNGPKTPLMAVFIGDIETDDQETLKAIDSIKTDDWARVLNYLEVHQGIEAALPRQENASHKEILIGEDIINEWKAQGLKQNDLFSWDKSPRDGYRGHIKLESEKLYNSLRDISDFMDDMLSFIDQQHEINQQITNTLKKQGEILERLVKPKEQEQQPIKDLGEWDQGAYR